MPSSETELLARLGAKICIACNASYPFFSSWRVCASCMDTWMKTDNEFLNDWISEQRKINGLEP